MKIIALNPNNYSKINFCAVSCKKQNRDSSSLNSNAISLAQSKIDALNSDDFQKGSTERKKIEKRILQKRKDKIDTMSILECLFKERKIIHSFTLEEIEQKSKNNREQEDNFNTLQEETSKIRAVVEELKKQLRNNDQTQAARRKKINAIKVGQYRENKGFSQIAGYDKEKDILYKYFISEIAKEEAGLEANIPNAIMFFGPKGNGKTTFAKAFSQEIGCENPIYVTANILTKQDFNKFLKRLYKTAEKANEEYEKTGKIQVIFIDEFDLVANEKSTILPELEEFMRTCYEKYHCILFAATNYPLKLELPLTDDDRVFPFIVSQDPPTLQNKTEILKYYLNDKLDNKISDDDYNMLACLLECQEIEKKGKYSIAQIRNEICETKSESTISVDKVIENIENHPPKIINKELENYYLAMDEIMDEEAEEDEEF